jgi:lipoprotein-releasing system ATP-binding protein
VAEGSDRREPVLRLFGLRKSYAAGTAVELEVLHGIDLTLAHGEFAALIGPSGSGKSTLLNLIGLLDRPTAGTVWIADSEASRLDDSAITRLRGRTIGFVFQYHNLLPEFTALENVMMPLLAARGRPDAAMRETAAGLLAQVGLTPWQDHKASDLSGGQQQRVAIARALAMNPALVLADEPSGNLDTQSADAVFDLLRGINVRLGTTFLIVTHDPRLAARCDRIIELVDGRIVADRPNAHPARRQPPASRQPAGLPGSAISEADGKHPNIRLVSGPE